jgi:uncharacterized membrane protein
MNNAFGIIIYCTLYAILNVAGAGIIKYRIHEKPLLNFTDWLKFLLQVHVLFAFFLIFLSALIMFKALSAGHFSITIPIATGINFIFTVLVGYFIFKNHITIETIFGCLLIIVGVFIVSLNQIDGTK